jgi:hypothetical protein
MSKHSKIVPITARKRSSNEVPDETLVPIRNGSCVQRKRPKLTVFRSGKGKLGCAAVLGAARGKIPRQQFGNTVHGMIRDACQHVAEVCFGIECIELS